MSSSLLRDKFACPKVVCITDCTYFTLLTCERQLIRRAAEASSIIICSSSFNGFLVLVLKGSKTNINHYKLLQRSTPVAHKHANCPLVLCITWLNYWNDIKINHHCSFQQISTDPPTQCVRILFPVGQRDGSLEKAEMKWGRTKIRLKPGRGAQKGVG